jgi:hypothetical protein
VSLITPRTSEFINIWLRSTNVHESTGSSLYGPDLSEWPSRMVDVFEILETERRKVDNARMEAERLDHEQR